MDFEQFWKAIMARNGWDEEGSLKISVASLKKLVKQAVNKCGEPAVNKNTAVNLKDLFGGGF